MATAQTHPSRHDARIKVDIRVHVAAGSGREIVLLSSDWTARSVFLRTREPFPLGTTVKMFVLVGHPVRPVALSGEVTRVVPHVSGTLHAREGMVVVFNEPQPDLSRELERMVWKKSELPEAPTGAGVLIVGDDAFANGAWQYFQGHHHEVARAVDAAALADLLADGLTPRCVVLSAACSHMLRFVASAAAGAMPPDIVVMAGVPPQGLSDSFAVPLVILPPTWPGDRMPDVIQSFFPGAPDGGLTRTSEEAHTSWFEPGRERPAVHAH